MRTLVERNLSHDMMDALDKLCVTRERVLRIDAHGHQFVVLTAEDFQGWQETAYLLSSAKNAALLQAALDEPLAECRDVNDVLNELDGYIDSSS